MSKEKLFGSHKVTRNLLDLGLLLQEIGPLVKINALVEEVEQKIKAGTATAADREVLWLLEEHSTKLLKFVEAISGERA